MSRFLVAYSTKHGATAEIAQTIADELRQGGHEPDCLPADKVKDVDAYDAAIIGSAVYAKRWRRGARRLLKRHSEALATRPFWIFSSGPCGENPDPSWSEPTGVVKRAQALGVRDHVVFGGRLPLEPRNFVERSMVNKTPPRAARSAQLGGDSVLGGPDWRGGRIAQSQLARPRQGLIELGALRLVPVVDREDRSQLGPGAIGAGSPSSSASGVIAMPSASSRRLTARATSTAFGRVAVEAERGHVDVEFGAVDLRQLAFAHQAQRTRGHLLGIPCRLDRLDDQLAVGVVVEVDERLGDDSDAVPGRPRGRRPPASAGAASPDPPRRSSARRPPPAPGRVEHMAYSAPCGFTCPSRPPSARTKAASAPIW